MQTIHVKREDVAPLIGATFPGYQGRKLKVIAATRVEFNDLNWSGGSRSQYRACELTGKALGGMDAYNQAAPWNNPAEGQIIDLPRGACVVKQTIFRGHDTGLTFYIHPDDMPDRLMPKADLAPIERMVLIYTKTRKASYGGKDRYDMAKNDASLGFSETGECGFKSEEGFPSREDWNAAKDALIARGLLNKRGAITNEGRNAIA